MKVPSWAYWGAQTQRAVDNFSVSDLRIPVPLIRAWAREGGGRGGQPRPGSPGRTVADAIMQAAARDGGRSWNAHFPIDVFQTGSGTSWNMNANEVIANRANEILGLPLGAKKPVHPNDHVNRGQSSNDVIPTVISMADREEAGEACASPWACCRKAWSESPASSRVLKIGRTHLQDAVPMTLGQELSGYARQIEKGREMLERCFPNLEELAIGGTAIGTGLNAHPDFAAASSRDAGGNRHAVSRGEEQVRGNRRARLAGGADGRADNHLPCP